METLKIEITPAIQNEIKIEIAKATAKIEKEMSVSEDLRRYDLIIMHAQYIKDMRDSISKGFL